MSATVLITDVQTGDVTTIFTKNEYDHVGRLLAVKQKIGNQDTVILAKNVYNEIGQLKEKKLHSENDGTDFITSVGYAYNERGWLTRSTSPQFSYQLKYNDGAIPQYNGNISQQLWGHEATTNSTFSYSYDKLNRLTNGTSTGTVMSEVLSYDNMGNILTLKRDNGTTMNYSYTGNRLTSLSGGVTGSYSYDPNGNALTDRTGMTFTYNHLNLPKTATKTGTSVAYLYDAMGSKLRKTATVGSTTTQREYVGGIEYNKVATGASSIEMIHTEEGYLQRSGTSYVYHYNLKDHLGNVRATLQRTTATTGTVVQKHDNYPFGKAKALLASGINKYLYNGKEIQEELDGQYDYGARFGACPERSLGDAEIGRWNVVDPLAEQMRRHSPYNYAFNNPIRFIDPDGMAPEGAEWLMGWAKMRAAMEGSEEEENDDEYYYNRSTKEYTRIGDFGGNTFDVIYYDNGKSIVDQSYALSYMIVENPYIVGERVGPGRWFQKHSGALTPVYPETYFIGGTATGKLAAHYGAKIMNAAKGGKSLLSAGELARIENAATRIGKPINVVGSRASGTAKATSDWDYVIEGLTNKQWKQIKNSLPGAPSRIDNLPRMIDIFKGPVDPTKPFITIFPK